MQQKSSFSLLSFLKVFCFLGFLSNTGLSVRSCVITDSKKAVWGQVDFSDCMNLEIRKIYADVSRNVNYLFIYLSINFAKRPESLIEQAPLRGPEKREKKISNTTNKNDNTLETTKKNGNAKPELGRTSIKNEQHIRSSKLFSSRLVSSTSQTDLVRYK